MLTNALKNESVNEFFLFSKGRFLDHYIVLLETAQDTFVMRIVLEGVYYMLKIARKVAEENQSEENMVLKELERAEVFYKFDELQDHHNQDLKENITNGFMLYFFLSFIFIPGQATII
mgnify:CR=1 FL=1